MKDASDLYNIEPESLFGMPNLLCQCIKQLELCEMATDIEFQSLMYKVEGLHNAHKPNSSVIWWYHFIVHWSLLCCALNNIYLIIYNYTIIDIQLMINNVTIYFDNNTFNVDLSLDLGFS